MRGRIDSLFHGNDKEDTGMINILFIILNATRYTLI